jgi:hypothetical protein
MVDRSGNELSAWEVWDPWQAAILGGHPSRHCEFGFISSST